jgi:ABC-type sulfate transport system substrate-binding protein
MTTQAIRERLHEYIRFADDKKLEAIYTMVEDDIAEELALWENEAFLQEMKSRVDDFESGKIQGISWQDVKEKAKSIKA